MEEGLTSDKELLDNEQGIPEDPSETDEDEQYEQDAEMYRMASANREKIKIIDTYINGLWSKRVFMSTCINICLFSSALYSGVVFIWAVILTALFHIVDKHLDFDIHKLHQKKDYAKYG
jgi:hypothetical protein